MQCIFKMNYFSGFLAHRITMIYAETFLSARCIYDRIHVVGLLEGCLHSEHAEVKTD